MSSKVYAGIILGFVALVIFIVIIVYLYFKYVSNRGSATPITDNGSSGDITRTLPLQIYSIIPGYSTCTYGTQLAVNSTTYPVSGEYFTYETCGNTYSITDGLLDLTLNTDDVLTYNMNNLSNGNRIFITSSSANSFLSDSTVTQLYACDGAIVTNNQINTNFTYNITGNWDVGTSLIIMWRSISFPPTTLFVADNFTTIPTGNVIPSTGSLIWVGQEWLVFTVSSEGTSTLLGSATYEDVTTSTLEISSGGVQFS